MDDCGYADYLQERQARIVAANPHLAAKITGRTPVAGIPGEPIKIVRQIFPKGRYTPRSLSSLIVLVARMADLHPDAISGNGRSRRLVDARSSVAVLAEMFAPRNSARAVDDALLRGEGSTHWYRERHADRLKAYPEYEALYSRCLTYLSEGGK